MAVAKKTNKVDKNLIEASEETKREYVKQVADHLESLKAQMIRFVTFDVGLIALTLTSFISNPISQSLTYNEKYLMAASLILVTLSAGFFMVWASQLQAARTETIDWMITLDVEKIREVHFPGKSFWRKRGWISILAVIFMVTGMIGYIIFIISLIFKS
jgi:hypothetical protein